MHSRVERQRPKTLNVEHFQFRQSEALLRTVLENAAVGMALIGTDGRLIYTNRAYAEMLGRDRDECIGLGAADLVHPDYLADADDQLARLARGETEGYQTERRYKRKDGGFVWALTSASMLRDERNGKPLYVIIQATDIGAQKRAEIKLATSESRWNRSLEAAGQGVWDHDNTRRTMFLSPMWYAMRGLVPQADPASNATEDWLARVHPEDRERVRHLVTTGGEAERVSFEYRERHSDGHYMWILSRGAAVERDASGVPIRFVGTDTDITAIKAIASALDEEREKLRVTLQAIGDGVISTDADARVTFLNPVAEQITGWTSTEAIGRKIDDVFVAVEETSGASLASPVTQALERQELAYLGSDAVLVSRSGERRAVRDSAAPVRSSDGELIGAVLVFQDVTNARAVQKELAHTAMHDALTGLPNRRAFERVLTVATDSARAENRDHAVCFIDLDRFKLVNDSAGHSAGDVVLQQIAHAIRRACRNQDLLARIGGDEFALLLSDCSPAGAMRAAQEVIDTVAGVRFTSNGVTHDIGASVGVAIVTASSPHLMELMRQADAACYAAKAAGRNRVVMYDPAIHNPKPLAETA
jgi:diguanylate cyclase (GGDEF)-like protein/PAS domain S-box-containing protein